VNEAERESLQDPEEYWTACFNAAYRAAQLAGDSKRVAHRKAHDEALRATARKFDEETEDHETS
jgi:hypothetical protein